MRILHILLIIVPYFAICQDIFTFPDELWVAPYSYNLKQLNIKKVEQYHTWVWKAESTFEDLDSSFNIDYIVEFDSLQRISSFKYDFKPEFHGPIMSGPEGSITVYIHNDSSRLERTIYASDTVFYNYYENIFIYNELNQLESVKVVRPYRSIIDGVYLAAFPKTKEETDEFFEDGLLTLRKFYRDGELITTERFEYKSYQEGDLTVNLLHKVFRESPSSLVTYHIHYHK